MGANYHTPYADGATAFNDADMNLPLSSLDRSITYLRNLIVSCDGLIEWEPIAGLLSWSGTLRIHFNRADGQAIQNTVVAASIALADNEFAYVDLNETNDSVLTVSKAAVSTGAASNFLAYNRVVLGYRNAASDEFYPVCLRQPWPWSISS